MSLLTHTKARFDYELLDTYSAGIELLGFEVKGVRRGHGSLEGTHVILRGGEAYLVGMNIPPFQPGNTPENYDPMRTRRLLLTKKELAELERKVHERGLTLVPISVYNKGRKLKVDIALAKGKKKHDKRETIKKRDSDREIRREWKVR